MAKKFYYDSVDILNATITEGDHNPSDGAFTASSTDITNEHAIADQSLSLAVTSMGDEETLRIDFGSNVTVTDILSYNNSTTQEEDNLAWYYNSAGTNVGTLFGSNDQFPPGWDLVSASSQTARFWYARSVHADYAGLAEVIMGVPLEFENEPDIGIATQEIFATDLNTSYGGVEYANKRHEPKTTFELNFSNISQTFKNNLVSFEQDVTNFKKFVYYDDSSYHYVRLDSPIKFTEVAFQRFSASLKLREQLT